MLGRINTNERFAFWRFILLSLFRVKALAVLLKLLALNGLAPIRVAL